MRATKPSVILTSLLPTLPKPSSKPVSSNDQPSSSSSVDYSLLLSENDEAGEPRLLLSVSRMNKFFQCPHAFYFRYVSSVPCCYIDLKPAGTSRSISQLWSCDSWMCGGFLYGLCTAHSLVVAYL